MKRKQKISIYTSSGEVAATARYRVYQYIDPLKYNIRYRPHLTNRMYSKWMPISKQPLLVKITFMIVMYCRGLTHLLSELIFRPDYIVIQRGLLTRIDPPSFWLILKYLRRKKIKFIWDFDDDILESKEIRRKLFDWLGENAEIIFVASPYNKRLLKESHQQKCLVLPTTDKDLYKLYNEELLDAKSKEINQHIKLIWLGSASGLEYIRTIAPYLDDLAGEMKLLNRKVTLTVVCNKPLEYETTNINICNVKWSLVKSIEELKSAHVGLMPLTETKFTQGKGGFKLIQYLSIGLPVVGSPVGINESIISEDCGCKADINIRKEWVDGLKSMISNEETYRAMSLGAYAKWQSDFSYENNLKIWESVFDAQQS